MRGKRGDEGGLVGHVFDHFHRGDQIELAKPERRPNRRSDSSDVPALRPPHGPAPPRYFPRAASTPVTSRSQPRQRLAQQPRAAADIERGLARQRLDAARSPPQCSSTASRIKPSRTGLSRWSMAEEPFGSHQSARQRAEMRGFVGRMVVDGDACTCSCPLPNRRGAFSQPYSAARGRPMARIVMKFGGTSMAGTERIRRVASIVRAQAGGRAMKWRWSFRPWRARPTGWSISAARPAPLYDPGGI